MTDLNENWAGCEDDFIKTAIFYDGYFMMDSKTFYWRENCHIYINVKIINV